MASIVSADQAVSFEPVLHPRPSFTDRLRLLTRAWLMKAIVRLALLVQTHLLKNKFPPSYTKTYPVLPKHECRVFVPKSYKDGDKPLPLLIDIHGGGFCFGAPIVDDEANSIYAHKHGFLVVSIPYRLAPTYPFPQAPKDVALLMKAIVEDESLPFDRERIAVTGYSAGANLSLAGVQQHELHDKIKAVVSVYAVTDFTSTVPEKLLTRVDDGKPDLLFKQGPAFNYCYVPVTLDRKDPLLSPHYAPRDKLPKHIFLLGCEHDLLCRESELMADKLGGLETEQKIVYADGTGWRKGGIRWELIKGMVHGFNQMPFKDKETPKRVARSEKMYTDVANWLKQEVFV